MWAQRNPSTASQMRYLLATLLTKSYVFSYDTERSPKKVYKTQAFNYRAISFVSAISKILEKNINSEILKYPEHHNLIHD